MLKKLKLADFSVNCASFIARTCCDKRGPSRQSIVFIILGALIIGLGLNGFRHLSRTEITWRNTLPSYFGRQRGVSHHSSLVLETNVGR